LRGQGLRVRAIAAQLRGAVDDQPGVAAQPVRCRRRSPSCSHITRATCAAMDVLAPRDRYRRPKLTSTYGVEQPRMLALPAGIGVVALVFVLSPRGGSTWYATPVAADRGGTATGPPGAAHPRAVHV
jgi:hypothetical protein